MQCKQTWNQTFPTTGLLFGLWWEQFIHCFLWISGHWRWNLWVTWLKVRIQFPNLHLSCWKGQKIHSFLGKAVTLCSSHQCTTFTKDQLHHYFQKCITFKFLLLSVSPLSDDVHPRTSYTCVDPLLNTVVTTNRQVIVNGAPSLELLGTSSVKITKVGGWWRKQLGCFFKDCSLFCRGN